MHFQAPFYWVSLFAFSKTCKDIFASWSPTGFMTNAMNSWFCYKRFIFLLLLKTLLCNSTEVGTTANWKLCRLLRGALLSHRPSRVLTQKCFHRALRPRLPFDILQVMTMVNGECGEMWRGECSSQHTHPLQTFVLGEKLPFFFSLSLLSRPSLCDHVRPNLSQPLHALVKSMLQSRAGFPPWLHEP